MNAICFTEVLTRSHCNPKKVVIQLVHAQTQILPKYVIASTTVMCWYSETVGQKIVHDNLQSNSLPIAVTDRSC